MFLHSQFGMKFIHSFIQSPNQGVLFEVLLWINTHIQLFGGLKYMLLELVMHTVYLERNPIFMHHPDNKALKVRTENRVI